MQTLFEIIMTFWDVFFGKTKSQYSRWFKILLIVFLLAIIVPICFIMTQIWGR